MCVRARVRVYAHARIVKILKRMSHQIVHTHAHTHTHSHVIIASCTSMYNFIYICKCTFTQICINRRSGWRSATRYSTPSKSRRRTQEQVAPLHVYCLLSFSHALSVPLSLQLTHSVSHARRTHACTHIHDRAHIHTRTQADDAQNGSASGGSGILRQQSGGSFSLSDVGGRLEEIVDGLSHGGEDDDAGWLSPLPSPRSGYIRSWYATGAVQVSSDEEEEEAGGEEKGEMAERPRWQHDDSMQVECGVGSREVGRRTVRRARGAGGVLLGRVLGEEERAGCKEVGASFTWVRGHAPLERTLPSGYVLIVGDKGSYYKKTEADGTVSISSEPPVREVRGRLLCYVIITHICMIIIYVS